MQNMDIKHRAVMIANIGNVLRVCLGNESTARPVGINRLRVFVQKYHSYLILPLTFLLTGFPLLTNFHIGISAFIVVSHTLRRHADGDTLLQ